MGAHLKQSRCRRACNNPSRGLRFNRVSLQKFGCEIWFVSRGSIRPLTHPNRPRSTSCSHNGHSRVLQFGRILEWLRLHFRIGSTAEAS